MGVHRKFELLTSMNSVLWSQLFTLSVHPPAHAVREVYQELFAGPEVLGARWSAARTSLAAAVLSVPQGSRTRLRLQLFSAAARYVRTSG